MPGASCAGSVRIHDNSAEWAGTTKNGGHFTVQVFPITGNDEFPGRPGSPNQGDRNSMTGLDVCIPDNPNSIPRPGP